MEAAGLSRQEIARRLGLRKHTVTTLVLRLRRRLGFRTRRELAALLLDCEVREFEPAGRPARHGFQIGDAVRVTGGHYPDRTGTYVGTSNSTVYRIHINGAVICIAAKYVQKMEQS